MTDPAAYALVSTAVGTAVLHTLIPDHWLPFVLIGRARRWSVRYTIAISGFSALVHALLSIGLGFAALGAGRAAATAAGQTLERASHVLLVGFGVAYAAWAWRKGGHFHPGGARLHGGAARQGCDGAEGDTNPEHLHYHADREWIRGAGFREWTLAFLIGANPCLLVWPLLLETTQFGPRALSLVVLAYAGPTVGLMIGLSALGVAGRVRLQPPRLARHMEAASGVLVALLGAGFWVFGH